MVLKHPQLTTCHRRYLPFRRLATARQPRSSRAYPRTPTAPKVSEAPDVAARSRRAGERSRHCPSSRRNRCVTRSGARGPPGVSKRLPLHSIPTEYAMTWSTLQADSRVEPAFGIPGRGPAQAAFDRSPALLVAAPAPKIIALLLKCPDSIKYGDFRLAARGRTSHTCSTLTLVDLACVHRC